MHNLGVKAPKLLTHFKSKNQRTIILYYITISYKQISKINASLLIGDNRFRDVLISNFELNEDEVSDDTMNQIMIFLGVMFGVQGANAGVKKVATAAASKVSKSLAQKALTKTTIYPIVKKIAQAVGIKMTKQIFAESVSKVVPVVGGVVTGGLSYATFKPCAKKLRNSFKNLYLSDPEYYKKLREEEKIVDIEDDDVVEVIIEDDADNLDD